ncbi:hypothetical protein GIB67_009908 [Kingdonia uniflora]|uniref:non-specific serine/threonine protein kinase n=1 Tax=Kingdonia uniflora TaxID=39325 RepID=A0A7J7L4D4_9MAGN|nr:hypothetical protein GIB67_009908 [Kingdonia uniflora]
MGNYCVRPHVVQSGDQQRKKGKKKANPFSVDYGLNNGGGGGKLSVLSNLIGRGIGISYELGQELGSGEFVITYLCTDKSIGDTLACKSILKKKLRTTVDIEDVRRELEIMKHLPPHPNIVRWKDTYEDDVTVHLVMELCDGGELFDQIVARGHYTERAAVVVTKTIVEVVQSFHIHGIIHQDLKPENFLFANKKETAALKRLILDCQFSLNLGERFTEIVGSPYYMAPEILKQNYDPEKAPNVSLGETVKARLKQFSMMNKLKKRASRVVTEHLSVEEVVGIKESFQMMDDNVMKFCTMKDTFDHAAKKQRLSSLKSQEVMDQITREINETLIEGLQRDLDVGLSLLDLGDYFISETSNTELTTTLSAMFFEMHQLLEAMKLQFMEILQNGNRDEALKCAKTYLSPLATIHVADIQTLMECLLWENWLKSSPYVEYLSSAHWDELTLELSHLFCTVIGQSY